MRSLVLLIVGLALAAALAVVLWTRGPAQQPTPQPAPATIADAPLESPRTNAPARLALPAAEPEQPAAEAPAPPEPTQSAPTAPAASTGSEFLPVPCTQEQLAEKYKGKSAAELYAIGLELREKLNAEFDTYVQEKKRLGLVDRTTLHPAPGQNVELPRSEPKGLGRVQMYTGAEPGPNGELTAESIAITENEYPDYFKRQDEISWLVKEWSIRRKH